MLFSRTVVPDCLLAHIGQLTLHCRHPCQMTSVLFRLALAYNIIMLFSRSVGSESLIYACCTACLALHASFSDDFILLFRANINWLPSAISTNVLLFQLPIVYVHWGLSQHWSYHLSGYQWHIFLKIALKQVICSFIQYTCIGSVLSVAV